MKKIVLGPMIIILAVLSLGVADVASGHHSALMFDTDRLVRIEGRLTQFEYTNPHAYLTLETTDDNGEVVIWELETVAALTLRRRSVLESDLVVGEWIYVEAYPPRNAARRLASAEIITKLDGTRLMVGFQGGTSDLEIPAPSVAAVASNLSGIWLAGSGLGQLAFPELSDSWPLTEKGKDALERYDVSQNPWVNCVLYAPPAMMLLGEIKLVDIGETAVVIRSQREDGERVIYIDGREHPENVERSTQGHSIGHWEGRALVVDTTHFTEHAKGIGLHGVPGGVSKRLTERFELSEDGTKIHYSFAVEDPEYLTSSVTGDSDWGYRPDLELETATCDPEVARKFLDAI